MTGIREQHYGFRRSMISLTSFYNVCCVSVTGRPTDGVTYRQQITPLHADTGESVESWVRILAVLAMGRSHAGCVTESPHSNETV